MKTFIALSALIAVASAGLLPTEPVQILSQDLDVGFDGTFRNSYQTSNGISVQEQGQLKRIQGQEYPVNTIQGSAQWTAPDGTPVELSWTADENGARFGGSHLPEHQAPTPPPIPYAIQRALDWIAAHPPKAENHHHDEVTSFKPYSPIVVPNIGRSQQPPRRF